MSCVHWVRALDITDGKRINGLESSMADSPSSCIGGLWSTFHPTDTTFTSDGYIVLGLQNLTKLKT